MIRVNDYQLPERGIVAETVITALARPLPSGDKGKSAFSPLPFSGVTYNVRVGDPIFSWSDEVIEPGIVAVSPGTTLDAKPPSGVIDRLCCIGNKVKVIAGESPGLEGLVIGSSFAVPGGVILDFPERIYQKLHSTERFWITGKGNGLIFQDYPTIHSYQMDPCLLTKLDIQQAGRNRLMIPVCRFIPADYFVLNRRPDPICQAVCKFEGSITHEVEKLGLDNLRFGDFIAISDLDVADGFTKKAGSVSIAIVSLAPISQWKILFGVNIVMSCGVGTIVPVTNPNANLGMKLGIGRFRRSF